MDLLDMRNVTPDLLEALSVSMEARMKEDLTMAQEGKMNELPEDVNALFSALKKSKKSREYFHGLTHTVEMAAKMDCGLLGAMAVSIIFLAGFKLAQAMLETTELAKLAGGPLDNYQN